MVASDAGLVGERLTGSEAGVEISGFMADDEEIMVGKMTIAPDAESENSSASTPETSAEV